MNFRKIHYLALIVTTIALGLLSRKITAIPPYIGDSLYAVMAYWLCRFVFIKRSHPFSFVGSLLFCYSIEFLQLVQHPLLINIRNNSFLRLIFGQGFLWSDLMAYLAGSLTAFLLDQFLHRSKRR